MSLLVLSDTNQLVHVVITRLRDHNTKPPQFREGINAVSLLLAPEALRRHLVFNHDKVIQTPLEFTSGTVVENRVALIPIMRAGAGMLPAFQIFLPKVAVWHITVSRDEKTHTPIFKDSKIPYRIDPGIEPHNRVCYVLDPMLATGGSASYTIQNLKDAGAKKIVFVGIFAAPEGIGCLERDHPDVPIIVATIDRELNDDAYILPGCGDAGDRQFPSF